MIPTELEIQWVLWPWSSEKILNFIYRLYSQSVVNVSWLNVHNENSWRARENSNSLKLLSQRDTYVLFIDIKKQSQAQSDWFEMQMTFRLASYWELLGQIKVMQIRLREAPNHCQGAIIYEICCLSCQWLQNSNSSTWDWTWQNSTSRDHVRTVRVSSRVNAQRGGKK